jgi:hypothetical protein
VRRGLRHDLFEHAALVVAISAALWRLREYIPLHTLPMRGDPSLPFRAGDLTIQWVPWLRVAVDALWRHGAIAFWNPYTHAGSPLFESPQAGVLGLATLLGGVVPVEAAVKWSILAHIAAGMVGVYLLTRRLGTSAACAAIGALSFALGTYLLDHLYLGHLDHVYAVGLLPWVALFLWTALVTPASWWRPAAATGIVLGIESLEGATSALVYSLMACCLVVLGGIGRDWRAWLVRLAGVAAVVAVCFFATAAPQLLPMTNYIGVTGRGGGIPLEQSAIVADEVRHPMPTITAAALMVAGVCGLWARGQRGASAWLAAIVAASWAAANVDAAYAVLWRYFPGIRYQRIPQRALVLVAVAGPVLVAAGMETAWRLLRRWKTAGAAIAVVGLGWFVYESLSIAPGTPPMVDPRIEQERNHAMRWLAARAEGSRIHLWEPPTRHWLADNVTVPLGLETLTGATPSEHHDYLLSDYDSPDRRTFLGDAYATPPNLARFWGLLNVRYVVATTPQNGPGFKLAAQVDACPIEVCQPAKAAGRYIYENTQWIPRAWMARHAIALVGDPQLLFEAALDILQMPAFDPAHLVVLQLPLGSPIPAVDATFPVQFEMAGTHRWRTGGADDTLEKILRSAKEPLEPARFKRVGPNRLELYAPSDGWLVASEKLALYSGWSASIKGKPADLIRADGVLAAVRVQSGDIVRAAYEPRGFRLGVALFLTMLVAIAGVERRSRALKVRSSAIETPQYPVS